MKRAAESNGNHKVKLTGASPMEQKFDFKKKWRFIWEKEKPLLYPLLVKKYDFAKTPVTVFLKVLCKF